MICVDWQIMVIAQLAILLLGTAMACLWYIRKLKRGNQALFDALELVKAGAEPMPTEQTEDEPSAAAGQPEPVGKAATEPAALDSTSSTAPTPGQEDPQETDVATQPQTALDPAAQETDEPSVGGDGFKKLLQQFTIDSRDMVSRIETLEQQTQLLIEAARETEQETQQGHPEAPTDEEQKQPEPTAAAN